MKKNILIFLICFVYSNFAFAQTNQVGKGSFNLVHWNVLKNMYEINGYLDDHHNETVKQLKSDASFLNPVMETFTPDSYTAVLDSNTEYYIHPNKDLIGKRLVNLNAPTALAIVNKAIKGETCSRGFYTWIDKQEKYMVVCPLIGHTKDNHKLYYAYTMYIRSMPSYYIETLKNSVQE